MATVRPFCALRPPAALAPRVASPPYDVINTAEARALAAGNGESFLHVSRAEIDLAPGTDEHSAECYARARENLAAFEARGTLVRDPEPHLYLYAQRMGAHRQVGVVGCVTVDEYDRDVIKKHEKTRADKEDDRTRHIDVLGAHDEPVFLTYRAAAEIDAACAEAERDAPAYDFETADHVRHTLWVLDGARSAALSAAFSRVPTLYVADGHHRSAAASRVHAGRQGQPGEHDAFLAVIFPHDQMQILAYNRVVRDPRHRSPEALLAELRSRFDVGETREPAPDAPRRFSLYLGGHWRSASVRRGSYDATDPVASLDASICQDQILAPIFGITDPRRDTNIDFVGGIRGAGELERRVDREGFSLAIHLHPTQIDELLAVSDAGLLMPPKSTWFEPKLRSGLFVHSF